MEGDGSSLCACIVNHSRARREAGKGGCGADQAVVRFDHCWEELLEQSVVRECVDVEHTAQEMVRCIEDAVSVDDAGVQQDHARITVLLSDLLARGLDVLDFAEIALDVVDVVAGCIFRSAQVKS